MDLIIISKTGKLQKRKQKNLFVLTMKNLKKNHSSNNLELWSIKQKAFNNNKYTQKTGKWF